MQINLWSYLEVIFIARVRNRKYPTLHRQRTTEGGVMASKRVIGIGLVSVGWMGTLHTNALKQVTRIYPELEIEPRFIIAADTSEERQGYARSVLGFEETCSDYMDVINHPDVEIISVCSPNFLHSEIGIAVAKAGKTLWIEKPVGRNQADTEALEAAVNDSNIVTTIGFNYRNAPAVEYARKLIASGDLGQITNIRGSFFADYSAEPNGALSWRFKRDLAGSGVLGDLMGHLVDLIHFTVGPISEVNGLTKTVIKDRPIVSGAGSHFAVVEGGERGPVENEDYAAMLFTIGENGTGAGAVGTLEASRVTVGPRAAYNFEIYGTKGSLKWEFERMNELELSLGSSGPHVGYQRIMANSHFGEFGKFQPGSGVSMGYDDLKVIEAMKLIEAFLGRDARNSNIHDAVAAARVCQAVENSFVSKKWESVKPVEGSTASIKR